MTPDKDNDVSIRIPFVDLDPICQKICNEKLQEMISASPLNGKIKLIGDKLRVNNALMKGLFREITDQILAYIKTILSKPGSSGVSILILVGGFSESKMVEDAVRKAYPGKKVIVPFEAGLAVLKGRTECTCTTNCGL